MKEKIYKYVVVRAESKREGTHLFRAQMVVQPPCGQRLYPFSQRKMSTFTGTNLPSPIFGRVGLYRYTEPEGKKCSPLHCHNTICQVQPQNIHAKEYVTPPLPHLQCLFLFTIYSLIQPVFLQREITQYRV